MKNDRENKEFARVFTIMLRQFRIDKKENEKDYPIDYSGTMPYSEDNLNAVLETGQPFLIAVSGAQGEKHFLVPDSMTQDGMTVMDCSGDRHYLSEYAQPLELLVYWRNDEGMMYCME